MADKKAKVAALITTTLASLQSITLGIENLILSWRRQQTNFNNLVNLLDSLKKKIMNRRKRRKIQRRLEWKKREKWYNPGRTEQWWINMKSRIALESSWRKNFRVSYEDFQKLVDEIRPYIAPNLLSPNHRALSAEKKVAITLYYLKDTGSQNMTANTFGVAHNTVSCVIFEVCSAITKYMGPKYLHLPKNKDAMQKKVSEFEAKYGMVQAFGCVDGTHVPISCPKVSSQDYFCYKHYYSINVQAVCDYRGLFMDVDCRWPGSTHDSKVFTNSSINKRMMKGELPRILQSTDSNDEKVPNYLIGDPAYPLTPFCMKEYLHCINNEEVIFNNILRSARNPIECAFGRLKARWSILTRKMDLKLENIPTVIYACFVLHNFCEREKSYVDLEQVQIQMELLKSNEEHYINKPDPIFSCNLDEGTVVRKCITNYFAKCI